MNLGYHSIFVCLLSFLPSLFYSFQHTGILSPQLNLFLSSLLFLTLLQIVFLISFLDSLFLEGYVFGGGLQLLCLSLRQVVLKRLMELIILLKVSCPVTEAKVTVLVEQTCGRTHHAIGMRRCEQESSCMETGSETECAAPGGEQGVMLGPYLQLPKVVTWRFTLFPQLLDICRSFSCKMLLGLLQRATSALWGKRQVQRWGSGETPDQ